VVILTAIFIGGFGAWLIESSRWLGSEARNYDKQYPAIRFLKMSAESFAETLARYSFDIPQMTRGGGRLRAADAVILYMDEDSSTQLKQGTTYDRRVHAELLRRLKAAGARAVFFDIVFAGERDEPDSPADTELAAALKEFGAAFIGGAVDITNNSGTKFSTRVRIRQRLYRGCLRRSWGQIFQKIRKAACKCDGSITTGSRAKYRTIPIIRRWWKTDFPKASR